jgi:hypothetical protein
MKLNDLENRASKLGIAFPPIPSYAIRLNDELVEEGAGKLLTKAYYKMILQFWMSPEVPGTSTVENFENMFIKSYDDVIQLMNFSSTGRADGSKNTNDKWVSVFHGYMNTSSNLNNIVIGTGVASQGENPLDRNKLVALLTWNKSSTPSTNNLTYDDATGLYKKTITATWKAGASDADRTIREVGLMYNISIRESDVTLAMVQRQYLFDRAELNTPITVKKTDTLNITYNIQYRVPWGTAG